MATNTQGDDSADGAAIGSWSIDAPIARRSLLKAGAGAAALAVIGTGIGFVRPAPAEAAVACSPRFDFAGSGGNPVWRKPLHISTWQMQSFAYDNVNSVIYFLQTKPGTEKTSQSGDLWITKASLDGTQIQSMTVHGFGHGVSLGVEPSGHSAYLWTEYKADSDGYGTRIARFPFRNGAVLEIGDPSIQDRTPALPGLSVPQPFVDPLFDRYYVRYGRAGLHRLVGYSMADARANRLDLAHRLIDIHLPARPTTKPYVFQGWAVCGSWAYLLEGDVGTDSYLTSWNIDKGTFGVDRFLTKAGISLPHREPEGMAIQVVGGKPRLAYGYTSLVGTTRDASVFYKDEYRAATC